jgi:hypothetical protein
MKLKTLFAAGLLFMSCMALAQQTDTKDNIATTQETTKTDKPKAKADKQPSRADKLRALTTIQDLDPEKPGVPVLKDIPVLGSLFQTGGDNQAFTWIWPGIDGKDMDQRVSLDVTDMPVKQALKTLCDQAKVTLETEKDVPDDAKVTVKLNNVRFLTALNAVTESAGIGYQMQYTVKDKKAQGSVKVGKNLKPATGVSRLLNGKAGNIYNWANGALTIPHVDINRPLFDPQTGKKLVIPNTPQAPLTFGHAPSGVYNLRTSEERHTFTCPHCKEQVTIISKRESPKCDKCGRIFQSDWKFCPFDGAKRPANADTWEYCPHCGKRVTP